VNTRLLEANIDPEIIRITLGHAGKAMTAHYAHVQLSVISEMQNEENSCSNKRKNNHLIVPAYIESLVNKGFVFPDSKRVVKSLVNFVYLIDFLMLADKNNQPYQ
jgi:hypothetical protein